MMAIGGAIVTAVGTTVAMALFSKTDADEEAGDGTSGFVSCIVSFAMTLSLRMSPNVCARSHGYSIPPVLLVFGRRSKNLQQRRKQERRTKRRPRRPRR